MRKLEFGVPFKSNQVKGSWMISKFLHNFLLLGILETITLQELQNFLLFIQIKVVEDEHFFPGSPFSLAYLLQRLRKLFSMILDALSQEGIYSDEKVHEQLCSLRTQFLPIYLLLKVFELRILPAKFFDLKVKLLQDCLLHFLVVLHIFDA